MELREQELIRKEVEASASETEIEGYRILRSRKDLSIGQQIVHCSYYLWFAFGR